MTDPISLIPADSFVKHERGKFSPKLDAKQRCEVLALCRSGVRRDVVARAYGIDRRTVGHVVNPQSPRYRDTRAEYKKLGHEEFIEQYLTEEVALKIANLPKEEELVKDKSAPSHRASRLAGIHKVQPAQCAYEHRIEIKWVDGESGKGWYYRDLDSKTDPESWFHNGDESRMTSHACYDAAVENLFDG